LDTNTGYHLLAIVQLLILFSIILVLDDELTIATRAAFASFALLSPSIFMSFGGLIYLERNVMFLLAVLMLCLKRFDETLSVSWAIGAILCAQLMIYSKEIALVLLTGLAASRLIFRWNSVRSRRTGSVMANLG
jgi:hypothetical protein